MNAAELSPLERHLQVVRAIGVQRPPKPDYAAYERMKRDLDRSFPALSHSERERAIAVIARAAGA